MENKAIKELNMVLKGEHMAIGAYERLIQDAKDDRIKNELQNFQQDHKRHAGELAQRIQALGGKPEHSSGFAGLMASAKGAAESIIRKDTVEIFRSAYDGEDKGIAIAEKIVKGDLDAESLNLVNRILSEDHDHLRIMANMIGELENRS